MFPFLVAVTGGVRQVKVFLQISQNSQESLRPANLVKKGPWHSCFPINVAKFLKAPFLQNTSGRLLLHF